MARGSQAKINVSQIIAEAFGSNFVGEVDKKLIVWADDGGEKVQIAISMTCPKNPVGEVEANTSAFAEPVASKQPQVEITAEETETLEMLMKKLGL